MKEPILPCKQCHHVPTVKRVKGGCFVGGVIEIRCGCNGPNGFEGWDFCNYTKREAIRSWNKNPLGTLDRSL